MRRLFTTLAACAAFAAFAGQSLGDTCTFTATSGNWDFAANWDCVAAPGADDTAIIPSGKTCKVEDANQAAEAVTVTGTLQIKGRDLTLCAAGSCTPSTVITGTVEFVNGGATVPRLLMGDDVTVDDEAAEIIVIAGSKGIIRSSNGATLIVDGTEAGGPILRNALDIETNLTMTGGHLIAGGGVMHLGYQGSGDPTITFRNEGGAHIHPQGGDLHVGKVTFEVATGSPVATVWSVENSGTIKITSVCAGCDEFEGFIFLPLGTLDVDANLCTTDKLMFGGGTIDVASGKAAIFHAKTCP